MATSTTEELTGFEEHGQQHDHAGNAIPPRVSDDGRTWWYPTEIAGRDYLPADERDAWIDAKIAQAEVLKRGRGRSTT